MDNILDAALNASSEMNKVSQRKELVQGIVDADDITQKQITFMLKKDVFGTGPRNAAELEQAIYCLYGIRFATKVSEEQWTPPFEWLHAMYFDTYPQLLGVAPRSSGKTMGASIITHFKCHHKPDYEATHLGARLEQAQVAQRYLANFQNDPVLNEGMESIGLKKAKWNNGSLWMIVAGTMAGVCLSGNTSVITDQGTKTMHEIVYNKLACNVLSYNFETKQPEWNQVTNWFDHGKETEFYKIRTEFSKTRGRPSFTGNHEVLLYNGVKKQVQFLTNEDSLALYDYKLSEDQHQLIIGSLLGDGTITPEGRFSYAHGKNQRDYAEWKSKSFALLGISPFEMTGGFGTTCYKYRMNKCQTFREYYTNWYNNAPKKVCVQDVANLTALGLAIWLMDDGCYSTRSWDIYTNGFSLEDQHALVSFFTTQYGITPKIRTDKRGKTKHYYLGFSCEDSQVLNRLVAEYLDVSSGKKVWNTTAVIEHGEMNIVPARVIEIEKIRLGPKNRKYDITVANNHNFFLAGGLLVSNSGQHPSMLSIDELEFLDAETLEQTWANPIEKNGHKRFWTGFSTRQRASSLMNILTQQAESGEKNIKLMQWSVFEVMQPCRECLCIKGGNVISEPEKACPLWKYCLGERARKTDGWMTRESVVNLMETMTTESFETQMLCLRPSSHGLVLSTFIADYATKLDINRGNYLNWTYQNSLPLYCWHDPADGGKSALCFVQIFGGKVFLFDELIMDGGPTIEKVKVTLWEHCMAKGYSLPKFIVMDPHRAEVYGKIWQEGNPAGEGKDRSYMVEYPDMDGTGFADIEPGLELTRALICNGIGARTFFVNPIQAKGYVTAITNNRYKVDKTNIIYQGAKQEPKYKDEIDSIRYGLIHAVQRLGIAANRRMGIYF